MQKRTESIKPTLSLVFTHIQLVLKQGCVNILYHSQNRWLFQGLEKGGISGKSELAWLQMIRGFFWKPNFECLQTASATPAHLFQLPLSNMMEVCRAKLGIFWERIQTVNATFPQSVRIPLKG